MLADGLVRPSRRRDDAWVVGARHFLRGFRACRDERDYEVLIERMPEFYAAHSVYADPEPRRRWSLEARIVSGEAFGVIGAGFGMVEGAVAAFEKIFFDDIEHLDTDYIPVVAVGLQSGHTSPGLGATWKWFAYHGGPRVLDFLLGLNPDQIKPGRSEQSSTDAEGYVRDELLKRVTVGALTIPVDGRSAPKLLDVHLHGLKVEGRARESAPMLEAMRPNLEAMWEILPEFIKTGPGSPTVSPAGGVNPGS